MNKAMAATELEKSLEAGIGGNIQELKRAGSAPHFPENVDGEMSSNAGPGDRALDARN
jgi:hypothetical protein